MITSAQSLNQLLAVASTTTPPDTRFLTALADHLEISGSDREAQAAALLQKLIFDIETDIDGLPLDDGMKVHLRKHLTPFNSIKSLSQVYMDVNTAKSHFLHSNHLVGLTNLHLALTGHIERPVLQKDAKDLAEKFRDIRDEILHADFPESLKRTLLKRTEQIASILEHYYAFGSQKLQEELQGLVGALVVNPPAKNSKTVPLFQHIIGLTASGLLLLTAVDDGLAKGVSIAENAHKLIEIVDGDSSADDATVIEVEVDVVETEDVS
ncbi:hypothetical protein BWR17_03995 [Phaeobacter inhibens]|uniref:hypothetical protein n=1 Tax=Phaeobacter inhibens TaxID=221822 RepID=UPI000971BDF6|nr:hypothetical protein [Phaeobacter inhibens]APX15092.1 hypothetical protein BWR17_03995 [Phaeobacter inhibens]